MAVNKEYMINIMFIIDFFHGEGGTERHLHYLVKLINKEKFNCHICSFNSVETTGLIRETKQYLSNFHHLPLGRYLSFDGLKKAFELSRIIRQDKIDIVQTYHYKADTFGVMVSKLSGVKHIVSSRRDIGDIKNKFNFFMNKISDRFIDQFITVCDAVSERISSKENVPKSKQKTIYNGVDLEKFNASTEEEIESYKKELNISANDFVVGTVSHFRPEKNYDVFLKAIKEVKSTIRNLKVIAIGSGKTMESSKQYCKDNGMSENILFAGQVKDVRKYISVMDVACLVPGSNEGFSNSILEKMAMGKPLIVTSVGGNAEAVSDDENGIVIPPLDSKKLAEALIFLYKNPRIRIEMGRKNRERVENLFTIENMVKKHENLYDKILRE